jgi:hypothetical protein
MEQEAEAGEKPNADEARAYAPAGRVVASVPGMDIRWEDGPGGIRIARLTGIIEATAVSLLSDEIAREVAGAPEAIVFDLGGVEYVSSSGWGQFAQAYEGVGAVALAGLDSDLLEVYECLEFRSFIGAYATDAEAIRALAGGTTPPRTEAPPAASPAPQDGAGRADEHLDGVEDVLQDSPADHVAAPDPWSGDEDFPVPGAPAESEAAWRRRTGDGTEQNASSSSDLDVNGARADERVGQDKKLRSLGWDSYGRQLRKRAGGADESGRKTDEKDEDPEGSGGGDE